MEAKLIETNEYGSEIRYSDGICVWPGYADNMILEQGYWQGTEKYHIYCDTLQEAQNRNRS